MFMNIFSGNENFGSYYPQYIYLFAQSPNHTSCLFCPPFPHPTSSLLCVHCLSALHPWTWGFLSVPLHCFLTLSPPCDYGHYANFSMLGRELRGACNTFWCLKTKKNKSTLIPFAVVLFLSFSS